MIVLLALLAAQPTNIDPVYPATVFESLCLRGEARFAQGSVNEVSWQKLQPYFRRAFGDAKLTFSERKSAERYGLRGDLPGFRGGKVIVSNDGNWAAIVEPMRPEGDQRCAVVARIIDRARLRKFGVVPVSFYVTRKTTLGDMVDQGIEGGVYNGAIVRIAAFGRTGALIQAYVMNPTAAEADSRTIQAIRLRGADQTSATQKKKED